MPTSDHHNITPLLTVLRGLNPGRVLDVGCGFGKFGVLAREYLDVWDERIRREDWKLHLEGIEAYAGYHNPIHDYVYNAFHVGEAQKVLPGLGQFDVILILDVIEHMEKQEAIDFVAESFRHSPVTIISTPRDFYPQQDFCGNPYEMHRCTFDQGSFPPGLHVHRIRVISCDIFVASREPIDPKVFILTVPSDYVYLWSRMRLGKLGIPVSVGLRSLCRWLG